MSSDLIRTAWIALFWPDTPDTSFMNEFMALTITPYIHVKYNQYRKDLLDKMRDTKSLEIRKALWNKSQKPQKRKLQAPPCREKQPCLSPQSTSSNKEIQNLVTSTSLSSLTSFPKKQLEAWCKILGLNTSCKKKAELAQRLKAIVAVPSQDNSIPGPSHARNEAISAREKEYTCPKCNVIYLDDNMWVGCDNPNCQLFICRRCASLEDEEDYQHALQQNWNCPFCPCL